MLTYNHTFSSGKKKDHKCPFGGCTLTYSDPAGLIKHQKNKHGRLPRVELKRLKEAELAMGKHEKAELKEERDAKKRAKGVRKDLGGRTEFPYHPQFGMPPAPVPPSGPVHTLPAAPPFPTHQYVHPPANVPGPRPTQPALGNETHGFQRPALNWHYGLNGCTRGPSAKAKLTKKLKKAKAKKETENAPPIASGSNVTLDAEADKDTDTDDVQIIGSNIPTSAQTGYFTDATNARGFSQSTSRNGRYAPYPQRNHFVRFAAEHQPELEYVLGQLPEYPAPAAASGSAGYLYSPSLLHPPATSLSSLPYPQPMLFPSLGAQPFQHGRSPVPNQNQSQQQFSSGHNTNDAAATAAERVEAARARGEYGGAMPLPDFDYFNGEGKD